MGANISLKYIYQIMFLLFTFFCWVDLAFRHESIIFCTFVPMSHNMVVAFSIDCQSKYNLDAQKFSMSDLFLDCRHQTVHIMSLKSLLLEWLTLYFWYWILFYPEAYIHYFLVSYQQATISKTFQES